MSISSSTTIKTQKASGYLQQLCKHFSHKIEVKFNGQDGWIEFAFGRAELRADENVLTLVANSQNPENLDKLKKVLASHLERFAFRESLKIKWEN
ncbi:MAG: DUF2218 domain-containing protein [Paracoccaceae bacterium]